MALSKQQEKKLFLALIAVLAVLILYRTFSGEERRTAPLAYAPGMKVSSPVRRGLQQPGTGQDALTVFLARRVERYPGVARDLFRVSRPAPPPPVKHEPVAPPVTVPTVTIPEKTAEQIAAETARADLSSFRFLGYVAEKDSSKESSLFLSRNGELFIAKSGDTLLKNYKIKSAGKDHVILYDTVTKVEVRVDLTGGDGKTK